MSLPPSRRLVPWLLALLVLSALPARAAPPSDDAGLVDATRPPAWGTWPTGRTFGSKVQRPADGAVRVCSFAQPVCVHARSSARAAMALTVLDEAERAMATLRRLALLPLPFADGTAGGSPAFDLYLVPPDALASTHDDELRDQHVPNGVKPLATADGGRRGETAGAEKLAKRGRDLGGVGRARATTHRVGFEIPSHYPVDRAAVFGLVDETLGEGCARATAIHRAVAVAMLSAIDGGESAGQLASTASYLAMAYTGCTTQALDAIDRAQARPQAASIGASTADDDLASPLLPWFLDGVLGVGAPGALVTALWYGGQQSTPLEASRFRNTPDLFGVLTKVAKARDLTLGDVLLDYTVWRGFVGDRNDGQHLAEATFTGTFGRPRFDASWPYESLPRRVAFTPLEPTGAVFVWVDLTKAPEHPRLGLRFEWEPPISMRWAIVRVDADGALVSRINVLHKRGDVAAEQEVVELEGVKGLLVVGVSVGEVALDHPYRPDEAPHELHGGTLHVFTQ